jgi:hypothetical protein
MRPARLASDRFRLQLLVGVAAAVDLRMAAEVVAGEHVGEYERTAGVVGVVERRLEGELHAAVAGAGDGMSGDGENAAGG